MSKVDLEIEIRALRKQVADLKEAAAVRRRLEAALRAGEELARATLDDCPIPLGRLDESGKLLVANEALARLLDYASRHELLELVPVLGLFADGDQFSCIRESAGGRFGLEVHVTLRRKGGALCRALSCITGAGSPPAYTLAVWKPVR